MIDINNKHNFEDLMGCCVETENEWLNKKRNGHICYGKGGGGGQQQQDVPPTLRPYVTEVLDRASDLYGVGKPFQRYEGERIVDFTADERAGQDAIRRQVGKGILGDETLGAASTYYDPALGLLGESRRLGEQAVSEITADEITGRMSPYQQAVTDIAKREAVKEAQAYDQQLAAQAAGTGGFGGSRQAILEAQAASDLGGRLSDIQARGSQAAYQDAVRAAEAQRARQAAGAQAVGGLSQLFGGLGQQALGQAYREAGYLSGLGEAQRGMEQSRADLAYQQFVEERDFPDQQLQKFSSLIQGFPFQFTQPQAMPSQFQQTVGGIATLGGLGRGLGFFKKGGGLSGMVKGRLAGNVGGLENMSMEEAYRQYLNLARSGKSFDREKREEELRRRAGMQVAALGANILQADPSRGTLAAIGQAAVPSIEGLSKIQEERAGLDAEERLAGMKDLLTQATILEKLRDAELAGRVDLSSLTGLSDAEFDAVDTELSRLQNPEGKTIKDVTPEERGELRRKAGELAEAEYEEGDSVREFEDDIRKYYRDLIKEKFNKGDTPPKDKTVDAISKENLAAQRSKARKDAKRPTAG